MVDAQELPRAVICIPANVHDSNALTDVVDAVEPIKKARAISRGCRKRPTKLHAGKGYDFERCRRALRKRGITPRIARRGLESGEKLARHRWVVERTLARLGQFKRLVIRYERRLTFTMLFCI